MDRPGAIGTAADGFSWHPPAAPQARELAVALVPRPFVTGWNRGLGRLGEVTARSPAIKFPPLRTISIPIRKAPLSTRSFTFAEPAVLPGGWSSPPGKAGPTAGKDGPAAAKVQARGPTRIKPPGDVIKLEDRLRYVLQPSLETLLATRSLHFPVRPFPFQLEGIAFLYPRHAAILADEMGLGKTMQAITALRLLLHGGEVRSVLLVCPKPLVANWRRELGLWAPEVPLAVVEGEQPRRRWLWQLRDVPVKIANYELLHRDRDLLEERDAAGRPRVRFDLVVLDESQRIKNRGGATSQAVRAIERGRSWALTGTPVENSPEDLVGIFEFLAPGFLSPDMKPRRMGRSVSDHVLRRTKDQVLGELPPKLFRDAELELTPEQQESYRLARDEGVFRLAGLGPSATIQHVFELVLRLKQICNFDPLTGASAKLERLEADLEEVATSGRKAIVFSQWVQTIQRLAGRLGRFGPLEYHGRVPSTQRETVIRRFRDDPRRHVLLISYGAGGVGLNLQFANYVFLFDRWWNPAVEDQAINRAHRIGISDPVFVSRFLILDTIEERIERILQQKREMVETIFSGTQPHRKLGLTQEELFGLFDLSCPGGPLSAAA